MPKKGNASRSQMYKSAGINAAAPVAQPPEKTRQQEQID
jgi:hypothetical protein